ncbi:MAG: LAGLIDADG family homing endonuclease [Candidatus Nanopelagicaceae bacterium]|nr:LAGLIDADG family homing endonuclease [Candidatus Nanopelagicaceae bacterium]
MEEAEIAWLAGIIDSEGSISMTYRKTNIGGGKRAFKRCHWLNIKTLDDKIVPECRRLLQLDPTNKPVRLIGEKLRSALVTVIPFLYVKRKQAEACLEAMSIKRINAFYTEEEKRRWERLNQDVKTLNAVGKNAHTGYEINDHTFHWAWLAGLIDGDGSITISKNAKQIKPRIKLTMTNHAVIDYLSRKLGVVVRFDKVRGNRRITKTMVMSSINMARLVPNFIHYLRLKNEQAKSALEIVQMRQRGERVQESMFERIYMLNNRRRASNELLAFLRGIDVPFVEDKSFDGYHVDAFFPSLKLAIKMRDLSVFTEREDVSGFKCIPSDHQFVLIYSDEWSNKRVIFEKIITHRLKANFPKFKMRPSACNVRLIDGESACRFYEANHYQGYVPCAYHLGTVYKEAVVACMSLRKPVRQNSGDWEIARMACDFDYRIHGLWSYLLSNINDFVPIKGLMVTFADKRLMRGVVYERMGMHKSKAVKSDYFWVLDGKRNHKSALRKPVGCSSTETVLRESQGYRKIYDIGKTKFQIHL